jgi:signal transduction histidine kinase
VLAEAVVGLLGVHAAFGAEHMTCFADIHTLREELAAAEERSRVAMDLHDDAVQRLFVVGMALQTASVSALDGNPAVATALSVAVDEIDAAIREIRTHVSVLRPPRIKATGQGERRAASPYRRQPRHVAPTRAS